MENKNQLMNFNRMELMGNLKTLVKKEKELTLEILDYLQEISNRKLFLEMGHPTLFAFLTEELGYCSGTAYLRIQTMKALEVPENRERVLKDKTSLNSLAKTQSFINNQNKELNKQSAPLLTEKEKEEFFAAAEGISANKVEELLKEKKHEMEVKKSKEKGSPPPVKKILKKFNFEADQELVGMIDELKSLLSHTCPNGDFAEILKKTFPLAIQEIKVKKGLIKRSEIGQSDIKKTNANVSMDLQHQSLNCEKSGNHHNDLNFQREKQEKTSTSPKDLHSQNKKSDKIKIEQDNFKHQNARLQRSPKTDAINTDNIDSIKSDERVSSMKSQCGEAQTDNLAKRFHQVNSDNSQQLNETQNNQFIKKEQVTQGQHNKSWEQKRQITRSIPVELKRKVWKRDSGCCQYQDPQTGRRCGSKHKLEFEHVKPWSIGGDHSLDNLWILCRSHNMYRWNSFTDK